MYNKVYKSTVYYTNNEPTLRPVTKDGKKNQFVNITSIYGRALVITPARSICNQYDVCMEINHANNWLNRQGLSVKIPENLNHAIVLNWDIKLGKALSDSWNKYLKTNIERGYLIELKSSLNKQIKSVINSELQRYGISYSMFLNK